VNGIVLALVGYWLTGAVNEGFKRQELHLANAREMRDLLRTLQGADTTLDDAQSSAFTLAALARWLREAIRAPPPQRRRCASWA
jgi:translation initiation factor 2B subunit (eIF-2B alpha/beta/delta family)